MEDIAQPTDDEYLTTYAEKTVHQFQTQLPTILSLLEKQLEDIKGAKVSNPKVKATKQKKKRPPMSADGEHK